MHNLYGLYIGVEQVNTYSIGNTSLEGKCILLRDYTFGA